MTILSVTALENGAPLNPEDAIDLRLAVEREVGPVDAEPGGPIGSKGGLADFGTILVSILSSQALTALIGLLKSKIDGSSQREFRLGGPGGTLFLKGNDAHLSQAELAAMIGRVLEPGHGGGDAARDPSCSG